MPAPGSYPARSRRGLLQSRPTASRRNKAYSDSRLPLRVTNVRFHRGRASNLFRSDPRSGHSVVHVRSAALGQSRPSRFVIRARSEDSLRNGYAAAGQHAFSLRRATKSTRAVGDLISHRFFICSILFLRAGCTVSPRNSPVLHAPASRREGWTSFGQCRSMLS